MSIVQKNMKYLDQKKKNLEFFESYLDISKLRILQILNEEQRDLEILKIIKQSNSQLLDTINTNFFKGEKTFIENGDVSNKNAKKELYFLIDAKNEDEYSEIIYKKVEESLKARIRPGDSVVTIGERVNLIAQKLELNIIQHFPYSLYENEGDFLNKVATIIEVGFKNGIFTDSTLIISQQNRDNNQLIMKKLAPFENDKVEIDNEFATKTTPIAIETPEEDNTLKQDSITDYSNFFKNLDIKKVSWIPNISFFKFKLIKSIIKQNIVELRIVEKIQRLKLEIQLLDEKKGKLHEESIIVQQLINRVRREKETESTIVLYSAFKVRNSAGDILDESIRKKKKHDEIDIRFYKKRSTQKGGV